VLDLSEHYDAVVRRLMRGRVVPFLGAGVNRCGRPDGASWHDAGFLPDGGELASYLAEQFRYPLDPNDARPDLLRVSQYVALMQDPFSLYEALHDVLSLEYHPTAIHHLLASLPAALRVRNCPELCPLIVTTNYDDLLERAFSEVDEPYDVIWYVSTEQQRGKFQHRPFGGTPRLIKSPNQYRDLPRGDRTIIVKIHGALNRGEIEDCSFVISEDDYIDYLARMGPSSMLPTLLEAKMKASSFLFLGYSLSDWNMRVLLRRIWGEQKLKTSSWAIQQSPRELDQKYWNRHEVEILDVDLKEYAEGLGRQLHRPPQSGDPA